MSDALRAALAAASPEPTQRDWAAVCAALEGLEGEALDEALALASPITSSWPEHIAQPPDAWLTRCMEAGREPRLRLVSTLSTLSRRISFEGIERLLASPDLTRLARLHIYDVPLTGAPIAALCQNRALAQLHDLTLRGCAIGAAGVRQLITSSLAPLRALAIKHDALSERDVAALLDAPLCARLTRLGVDSLGISPTPILDRLARWTSLEALHIDGCGFSDAHVPALRAWPGLASLQSLSLGGGPLSGEGFAALCEDGALDGLDMLELKGCPLGALAIPARLTRLTHLNLAGCQIGDAGAATLAAAQADEPMMFLDLNDNQIGPVGALALARSPRLAGVQFLHVRHNPIGDDGLLALLTSPHMRQLCGVIAERCEVGDTLAAALGEVLSAQPALRDLFLLGNLISDLGAAAIAATPAVSRLRNLVLLDNPLSRLGWQTLADSPHIEETWRAVYQREASR